MMTIFAQNISFYMLMKHANHFLDNFSFLNIISFILINISADPLIYFPYIAHPLFAFSFIYILLFLLLLSFNINIILYLFVYVVLKTQKIYTHGTVPIIIKYNHQRDNSGALRLAASKLYNCVAHKPCRATIYIITHKKQSIACHRHLC